MSDFSYLNKLAVDDQSTAEFTFTEIEGYPTLIGKPAAECNERYFNAVLRRQNRKARVRMAMRGNITANMLSDERDEERKEFADHVITGWDGVVDAKGKDAPFNAENCMLFFQAMPDDVFDRMKFFFQDLNNFRNGMAKPDTEETAKNSSSA